MKPGEIVALRPLNSSSCHGLLWYAIWKLLENSFGCHENVVAQPSAVNEGFGRCRCRDHCVGPIDRLLNVLNHPDGLPRMRIPRCGRDLLGLLPVQIRNPQFLD